MNKERIAIANMLVWPSDPYRPTQRMLADFVGRDEEMRLITAAWMAGKHSLPLAPLLVGEPGVGKNRLVYELGHRTARDLYIFQGHEDVTAEDLACAVRFSDDPDTKMDYVISPLVTAMLKGGICFIDEIGKIRPRALALLVSVLDERRYIDSTLLGMRVTAHPNFRFVAATNTGEINALPEFIRSRMRPVTKVGYPPRREIDQIITNQFPGMQQRLLELLDAFWILWEKQSTDGKSPSPRDAIHLFGLASSLSDFERLDGETPFGDARYERPFSLNIEVDAPLVETRHLELAFQELFHKNAE